MNNFKSFGPKTTQIRLEQLNFLIGSNGSGKTAVLESLSRLFAFNPAQRKICPSDFHAPLTSGENVEERSLWIECDFVFPELDGDSDSAHTIPPNFRHLRIDSETEEAVVRYRLEATLHPDGNIEEKLLYVLEIDKDGGPTSVKGVSYADRNYVHVHYLPARRDPVEHISFTARSLLGKVLRSGSWEEAQESIGELTKQISETLGDNSAVSQLSAHIGDQWSNLHSGSFFKDPAISFQGDDLNSLMRLLSISFSPGHGEQSIDFSRLSDGEKSLLYFTLVLSFQNLGRKVLNQETDAFDPAKLAPPVYTIIAIEEPENSLAPHYLGRIISSLETSLFHEESGDEKPDLQAIIATHSPSILSRAEPSLIRHLRLDENRCSQVREIVMPEKDGEAYKFVREAVLAYPELYFSRLVLLGEGDSEEIVLSRLLKAHGLGADQTGISIVPLGGRHVNHFWRLLSALEIPYITLLDLDLARFGGGWGRIKYASTQLLKVQCEDITEEEIDGLEPWNSEDLLFESEGRESWVEWLETQNVFFSAPLDLDFSMIDAFPEAYGIGETDLLTPDKTRKSAVLGKAHFKAEQYSESQLELFESYHKLFKLGSKPGAHFAALGSLNDDELCSSMPEPFERIITAIEEELNSLPE